MTEIQTTTRDLRRVFVINMFSLLLTFSLSFIGFFVTQPAGIVRVTSASLLIGSLIFNVVFLRMLRQGSGHVLRVVRIYFNLAVNVSLVYLLGHYFSPMWLILAIAPVSSAIYGTRRQMLLSSGYAVGSLIVITVLRGIHSPLGAGELISRVLFIVVLSLLINESVRTGNVPLRG
jgi:hypothetical protein